MVKHRHTHMGTWTVYRSHTHEIIQMKYVMHRSMSLARVSMQFTQLTTPTDTDTQAPRSRHRNGSLSFFSRYCYWYTCRCDRLCYSVQQASYIGIDYTDDVDAMCNSTYWLTLIMQNRMGPVSIYACCVSPIGYYFFSPCLEKNIRNRMAKGILYRLTETPFLVGMWVRLLCVVT